ncbi:nitrite reductase small subunit NirD [Actinokineospora bangkokensis]|uniref:Nitrite reductase small subunit n=1 Tax=Actinokineospora bangkokensis TaxID=1193682 RepID=A0A1Q9LDT4_9PSEU|nr:nitrite reductase small subunit NirD [Actinokineospora bangkokensis]OLR90159.1 nitrite reductase small subunit [Actinokineospora bangkokensis]
MTAVDSATATSTGNGTGIDAWTEVCPLDAVPVEEGRAVLLPDGTQVAVFRTHDDQVHALCNVDPFSGAAVLSRGIVGDLGGVPVVASPMHKQHFDLRTGACVEDASVVVATYPVRVRGGTICLGRT